MLGSHTVGDGHGGHDVGHHHDGAPVHEGLARDLGLGQLAALLFQFLLQRRAFFNLTDGKKSSILKRVNLSKTVKVF